MIALNEKWRDDWSITMRSINVWTKIHGDPSNSGAISLKTANLKSITEVIRIHEYLL